MIGLDPILENLSVIILSLSKSFSISTIIFLSFKIFFDFMYSFQAFNEDNGVPYWWAVSFANPVQSLSFSDALE